MIRFIDKDYDEQRTVNRFRFYLHRVQVGMRLNGNEAIAAAWWLCLKALREARPEYYTTDGNNIVCTRMDKSWWDDFKKFVSDLGYPPADGKRFIRPLRINPSLGYSYENVVWGTQGAGEEESEAALRVLKVKAHHEAQAALSKEIKRERERIKAEATAKVRQAYAAKLEARKKVLASGPKLTFEEFRKGMSNA